MRTLNLHRFLWLALGVAIVFSACKGRENTEWDGEIQSAIDNSFASSEFSAIHNIIDVEARSDTNIYGKTDGFFCPFSTSSVDNLGAGRYRLTVNFGSGANCVDGRLRVGKLVAEFDGKWRETGTTVTITPDNYSVSGFPMFFTQTITYNGLNMDGNPNWDAVVTDGQLVTGNGVATWESTRNIEWVEGVGGSDPSNNEYLMTGNATGMTRYGLDYTVTIDQAVRLHGNCANLVQGVISLTPDQRLTRSIDYGTGFCDNQAVLTVGTFQSQITLP